MLTDKSEEPDVKFEQSNNMEKEIFSKSVDNKIKVVSPNSSVYEDVTNGMHLPEQMSFEGMHPYIVFKGYTAKRKDEISLPLGTTVYILAEKIQRKYVAAVTSLGQEFDRGWVPYFCLQLKDEAVDVRSMEGIKSTITSIVVIIFINHHSPLMQLDKK